MSARALGSAGKPSAVIAGGRNEDGKLLQAVVLRWWLAPGCAPHPWHSQHLSGSSGRGERLAKRLALGDARICSCCAVSGAAAARQEMSARAGSAACTSCRGCQPGARSSSIPAVRLHRQQGQSPAWGWQLQPRRWWKQIRRWGSRSSLPAGAEPATPNRSRRRLPLPRAQQTDRRPRPAVPRVPPAFGGRQDEARVAAGHLLLERLAWWLCYPSWPAGRDRGVPLT